MSAPRKSRLGWSDPMDGDAPEPTVIVYRLPRSARNALVGLVGAVFLLAAALGLTAVYVYQANQYVEGRGEFRDEENDRTNQRINDAICDLLDQLPEGGLLERPRTKYGCGPGIPISQLTPGEQRDIARRTAPPVDESVVTLPPEQLPPREGPGPRDFPLPTEPAPEPEPAPDPIVDPEPITDPICDALGVCP